MSDTSASSPIIRPMVPSDLDQIVDIDTNILGEQRTEYWELKLQLTEKRSPTHALVAEADGKVIGFIIGGVSMWGFGVPKNIGWIDTIGVHPDHQRKGVAKIIFNELITNLKKEGVISIITFVMRRDLLLLKFFNSLGFQRGDMINLELIL